MAVYIIKSMFLMDYIISCEFTGRSLLLPIYYSLLWVYAGM